MEEDDDGRAIRRRRQRLIAAALTGLVGPLSGCDELAPQPCLEAPIAPAPVPGPCLSETVIDPPADLPEPIEGPALPPEEDEPPAASEDEPAPATDEATDEGAPADPSEAIEGDGPAGPVRTPRTSTRRRRYPRPQPCLSPVRVEDPHYDDPPEER